MFRPVAGVSLPLLSWAALAEQSGKLVLLWHITALQQEKQTQKRLRHQKKKQPKQSSSYANSHLFTCSFTCGLNLTHFRITVLTSTGFASWDFLIKAAAVWWQMNQRSVSFSIMPQSKAGLTFTHAHTHKSFIHDKTKNTESLGWLHPKHGRADITQNSLGGPGWSYLLKISLNTF